MSRIKQIIAQVAGIDANAIADDASLTADLKLDSLSLLEIAVDVDLAFQLNLPDETYKGIDSLPAIAALVHGRLMELAAGGRDGAPQPAAAQGGRA
ncbi:MAG TPA: phosphopantetheine-binding protein [Thermoanaerobaculia bacterium]|nr:phosphopantetheine-binding protein [Thermoanaerobaculia bacterium]